MIGSRLIALCLLFSVETQAAQPSREVVFSCLAAGKVSEQVQVHELVTNEVAVMDDFGNGYAAKYMISFRKKGIGYALRRTNAALIFGESLLPLKGAKLVIGSTVPTEFNPFLASWSIVNDRKNEFLCVSFPVGALGQSGPYQKIRGGFLLEIKKDKAGTLYSAVANIDDA